MTELDPLAHLRAVDPATDLDPAPPATPPWVAFSRTRPARRRRPRPRRVLVGAAAAAAIAVVVAGLWFFDARDTPAVAQPARLGLARPLPPGPTLIALADRIDAGIDATPTTGVTYTRTVSWNLQITVDGDETSMDILPEEREAWWRTPDGLWDACIHPGPPVEDGEVFQGDPDRPRPEPCAPGVPPRSDHDIVVTAIADDPVAAGETLGRGGPEAPGYRGLENMRTILSYDPLAAAERADLLRGLATLDGFEYRGEVVDRVGRPALAFASRTDVHGGGAVDELVVLLDPDDGSLLGSDSVLLDAGTTKLDVEVPAVQGFELILEQARVPEMGDRPER